MLNHHPYDHRNRLHVVPQSEPQVRPLRVPWRSLLFWLVVTSLTARILFLLGVPAGYVILATWCEDFYVLLRLLRA